ncbi:MAG TPA: hypothetical protein VML55_11830 [Planctomycetaceae bacterium]|nr:hypothetical protein [Planctomycetaceae bacterium]
MATSTDVNLPRSHAPRFPDRCVVCGRDGPVSHLRVITGSIGWWTWLLWWFGKPFVVWAPSCRGCAWRLHGWRLLSLLLTIGITLAALFLVWPHFKDAVPQGLRKWAMMGIALVCLSPQLLFETYFARPFDITAFAHSVDYEFTSKDYAVEFAVHNLDAEWVKVNGTNISSPESFCRRSFCPFPPLILPSCTLVMRATPTRQARPGDPARWPGNAPARPHPTSSAAWSAAAD